MVGSGIETVPLCVCEEAEKGRPEAECLHQRAGLPPVCLQAKGKLLQEGQGLGRVETDLRT